VSRPPKPAEGYRNQSAAPETAKPEWTPVVCPKPIYSGITEKLSYEYAVESNPRKAGEPLLEWMKRVSEAAVKAARETLRGENSANDWRGM
jgi:hypothetical protein